MYNLATCQRHTHTFEDLLRCIVIQHMKKSLGFELLVGQNKQFGNVALGNCDERFIAQTINQFFVKLISRLFTHHTTNFLFISRFV